MQIIFCIWAIGRASSAIAGEIDRGTMELLSRPADSPAERRAVAFGGRCNCDPAAVPELWGGTILGCRLVGPFTANTAALKLFPFPVHVDESLLQVDPWAFGPALWNVGGLAVRNQRRDDGSCRLRADSASRVIGLAVLIFLLQFLVNVVGQLWDAATWLRPLTVFFYYQPQQIVLSGKWTVDPAAAWGGGPDAVNVLAVLFAVGAIGYAAALWIFARRDLPAPL